MMMFELGDLPDPSKPARAAAFSELFIALFRV